MGNRWEKMLKLREELLAVEEDRMAGRKNWWQQCVP